MQWSGRQVLEIALHFYSSNKCKEIVKQFVVESENSKTRIDYTDYIY